MTTTFDPAAYKDTTRPQWDEAAAAWHAWGPTLEDWLGEATTLMLDAAGIHTGSAVLDVAAGAGGQSLTAARRVGPAGQVLATDISPAILRYAAESAAAAGLTTVQIRQLDGEHLDVEPAGFDAVISRLGLIYLPDQPRALAGHAPGAAARRPHRGHRLLHPRPQRLLLRPGAIARRRARLRPARTRPARTVQPRRARRARTAAPPGRIPRRRHATPARPAAAAARRGLRPLRARVLRRTAPDARRTLAHRARPGLAGDQAELARFERPDGFRGPAS